MMDEPGSFFICTETSPRCYIIQKVSARNVEKVCEELSGLEVEPEGWENGDPRPPFAAQPLNPPPLPVLPWWWTPQCERELEKGEMGLDEAGEELHASPPSLSPTELRQRLKLQLEYYFSRENLAGDNYLRSQMDNDQYVPVHIIASFPMIKKLTIDTALIKQVLRTCHNVQVDESGGKVRPAYKRSTLLLREIPEGTQSHEIENLFFGPKCPRFISVEYAHNQSWYVNFETDEEAQKAFLHLRTVVQTFKDRPIHVRIKTGPAPRLNVSEDGGRPSSLLIPSSTGATSASPSPPLPPNPPSLLSPSQERTFPSPNAAPWNSSSSRASPTPPSNNFDLGFILALNGFQPQGTFRPLMVAVSPSTMQHFAAGSPRPSAATRLVHSQASPSDQSDHSDPAFRKRLGTPRTNGYDSYGRAHPPPDPVHSHPHYFNPQKRPDNTPLFHDKYPPTKLIRRNPRYDDGRGGRGGRWSPPPTRRHTFHRAPGYSSAQLGPSDRFPVREVKRRSTGTVREGRGTGEEEEEGLPRELIPEAKFELQTTAFPPLSKPRSLKESGGETCEEETSEEEAKETKVKEEPESPPTPQWPSLGKRNLCAASRTLNPKISKSSDGELSVQDKLAENGNSSPSSKDEEDARLAESDKRTSYAAMAKKISLAPPTLGRPKKTSESSH